nr:DNA double-strand break repair nuclease NurA [Candidatus Sigynarchaeum springense]MDO8116769.1 DNA double-strand break repair nuclease NurA [Candidatus Sigynarchaeota archaeon]
MPLDYNEIANQLAKNLPSFEKFAKKQEVEFNLLKSAVPGVFSLDFKTLDATLAALGGETGARPTVEYQKGLLVPYPRAFASLKECVDYARQVLKDVSFTCTDGSQIYPSPDFSIPVAVVQIVHYRNDHCVDRIYEKRSHVEILPPDKLESMDPSSGRVEFGNEPVNARRAELELEVLCQQMIKAGKRSPRPKSAMFMTDGSLIASFTKELAPSTQKIYISAIYKAIDVSKTVGYPFLGFVDSSAAKDVVKMISLVNGKGMPEIKYIPDAAILEYYFTHVQGTVLKPGDRTCAFICDRGDAVYKTFYKATGRLIGFFYIKLSSEHMARVEFPSWCLDQPGLVDQIATVVLAECFAGAGYPHSVDQAHHACVIQNEDREKFYRLFQHFAMENRLVFKIKNKARSKRRRY